MVAVRVLLVVVLAVAAFWCAAKTHGRQVRLERERAGFMSVTFGTGANPAFVEALWRRDRVRFWPTAAVVALACIALALHRGAPPLAGAVPLALWAGMVSAFLVSAALSALSFAAMTEPADPEWLRNAWRGTAAWWCAAIATTGAMIAALIPLLRAPP